MTSFILLFASSPIGGKGGAATVINSYIDFFKRNESKFDFIFIPFHATSISQSIKILRYLPSLLIGYRLLKNIFLRKKFFYRSTNYVYWHSYGLLDSFLLLLLSPLFTAVSKHHIVTLHSPNFYPINDTPTFSQRLYYIFISLSRFNQHHLNTYHLSIWKTKYNGSISFGTRQLKNFVCLNPLSNTLATNLKTIPKSSNHAINTTNTNSNDSISIINTPVNILSLSQLIPGKNVHILIESLLFLSYNFHLTIAGDGPLEYRLFLEESVEKYNLNTRVSFVGFVDHHRKQRCFDQANIFCVPSINDTQSLVNIEAVSANLSLVLFKYPPFLEIYSNLPSIFWAEDLTSQALASQLLIASRHHNLESIEISKKMILEKFADENLLYHINNL